MKSINTLKQVIKCPYCDREYLPSEIFYPDHFLGQECNIEKDTLGTIVYYEGTEADHTETFICENCNKPFKVVADIKFTTYEDKYHDLDSDYESVKPIKLFLDED